MAINSVHDASLSMESGDGSHHAGDDPKLGGLGVSSPDGINKSNKCQTCGKEFRRVYDLNRHQKLHTGQKPHACQRCAKKFSRADALIRHMRPMGSCAQRFSMQTAQAASSSAGDTMASVLDPKQYHTPQISMGTPPSMRPQYSVALHSPSNMRPEDLSALLHRVQTLEKQMHLIEQRMNRAEHRVNRLEIAKSEHASKSSDESE